MFYKIKKNSISNYPTPTINAAVLCFISEEDFTDENKAVYWIPFTKNLEDLIGKTSAEIDDMLKAEGEELFNKPENQTIFSAIELGLTINTPEII